MTGGAYLRLQICDPLAAGWRDVVAIHRPDDIACAYALAAAPLLARASTHSAELRIADEAGQVYCTWDVLDGWTGALPSGEALDLAGGPGDAS